MSFHLGQSYRTAILQATLHAAGGMGKSKSHLLRWLMSFGALGLFFVAAIDSSVIPLPLPGSTDLLLLLLASQRGSSPLSVGWLAVCAFSGSVVGGYLAWSAGGKGGEVTLERYVPKRFLARLTDRVQRHGPWTVAIAALLPPPVPLTPFVIAAGALKVPRLHFLLAFGFARLVRYALLAWLGFTYGRHIAHLWQQTLSGWGPKILWTYGALVLAAILFGIWKYRQNSAQRRTASQPA
ncbi:MAG TPA: VTT domain-containing protein [Acidobacteriaceae bacterium]